VSFIPQDALKHAHEIVDHILLGKTRRYNEQFQQGCNISKRSAAGTMKTCDRYMWFTGPLQVYGHRSHPNSHFTTKMVISTPGSRYTIKGENLKLFVKF